MAMRMMSVLALAAVVAVAATCAEASHAWNKHGVSSFTVTGQVLCQDCRKSWNAYAYTTTTIPKSVVGITCLDSSYSRTVYHATDETDSEGWFNIKVPCIVNGAKLDPTSCLARLAKSGNPACAILTDFNGGKRPNRPSEVYPDNLKYVVGPFHCTVPECDTMAQKY